jgi:hypothetical protein
MESTSSTNGDEALSSAGASFIVKMHLPDAHTTWLSAK